VSYEKQKRIASFGISVSVCIYRKHPASSSITLTVALSRYQWMATVTFKVTTLPLLRKKSEVTSTTTSKKVMSNFALQTTTTFVKKGSMIFFCPVVLNHLIFLNKHNNLLF